MKQTIEIAFVILWNRFSHLMMDDGAAFEAWSIRRCQMMYFVLKRHARANSADKRTVPVHYRTVGLRVSFGFFSFIIFIILININKNNFQVTRRASTCVGSLSRMSR